MTSLTQKASSIQDEAFLLTKKQLFQKADFTQLFDSAIKKHGRFFVVYYQKDEVQILPTLGFVVSKKYTGTSIKRNLIKRLVREYFRLNQHDLKGLKVMLVVKKNIGAAQKNELHQDLEQLFSFLKKLQS